MYTPTRIIQILRNFGHQAYFVGGCVRDHLLGLEPKDWDIATSATQNDLSLIFPTENIKFVGASFGVALVDGVEVATFRKDGIYLDGRHPEKVTFTTNPEEDAARRDFTINAIYKNPETEHYLDFFGGRRDLKNKILRFVGDPEARIQEDFLRMLRAIRFASRFGFEIEWYSWLAIQKHADKILEISQERIFGELDKIFRHKTRGNALTLLRDSNILKYVLPEVQKLHGCKQRPDFHPEGDVFVHTRIALGLLPDEVSSELAWGMLLHDVGKPGCYVVGDDGVIHHNRHERVGGKLAKEILERLRCSNDHIRKVCELVENHMRFCVVEEMKRSKLVAFARLETFEDQMKLHYADCMSSHEKMGSHHFMVEFLKHIDEVPTVEKIHGLINGKDLTELGLTPGPLYKEILDRVRDLFYEGTLKTKEDALNFVRGEYLE